MCYLYLNARNEIGTQNKYKIKSEKRLENKPVSFFICKKNIVSKLIEIHATENCRLQQIVAKIENATEHCKVQQSIAKMEDATEC